MPSTDPDRSVARWLDHPLVAAIVERASIITARRTFSVYGAAAGGLLASGLAYSGIFAVFSASLFLIGLLGFLVRDPVTEATIVGEIARRVPPVANVLELGLQRVAGSAVQFSIAGLIGLGWSAGRFYENLDVAFARIFEDEPGRDLVVRFVRGIVVVALLTAVVVVSIGLAGMGAALDQTLRSGGSAIVRAIVALTVTITSLAVYLGSVGGIYRLVPPRRPSWRSIRRPAVVVAVLLAVLTAVFVQFQSHLLGSLELFTEFVGVLATMIWLSIAFQILLIGGAWVRVRDEVPRTDGEAGRGDEGSAAGADGGGTADS
ncbi:MAG: YihY/virulence factor BrkB family protein [Chloroflexi bacterium]|nr:YihY/virulence factor BrkB family protein [Chloroflexota bacterium]